MKKLLLFSFIASLLFSGLQLSAQFNKKGKFQTLHEKKMEVIEKEIKTKSPKAQMKLTAVQGNPTGSQNYNWVDEDWLHVQNSSFSYNEMGLMTGFIVTDAVTGVGIYKVDYGFDSQQNQVQFVYSEWLEGAWMIIFGFSNNNSYDDSGNVLESISQFYNSATMEWENSGKYSGLYNEEGTLIEEKYSYWDGSDWQLDYKYVYTINEDGSWSSVTGSAWGGSEWLNDFRLIDWVWQDFENWVEASAVYQEWIGNAWMNIQKFSTEFTGDDYIRVYDYYIDNTWEPISRTTYTQTAPEHVYLYEEYSAGDWLNSQRVTDYFDDHQNFSGFKYEYWMQDKKSVADSWVIDFYIQEFHTYNENDELTEVIVQYWDIELEMLVNVDKIVYTFFLTAISEKDSGLDLTVYPNPVESILEISSNGLFEHSRYVVVDLNGRIIKEGELQKGNQSLDVSDLNSGMYFLNVSAPDSRRSSFKLLKR